MTPRPISPGDGPRGRHDDGPGDQGGDETIVRERFRDKVRRTLGRVPFVEEAAAAYYAARDPATPRHVKAVIVGALAYFIMPVDAIPDFIAAFGYTDDAAVFWAAWRTVSGHVTDGHRARARKLLEALRAGG